MEKNLTDELRTAIASLKKEIIEKQQELDILINQYQEVSEIEVYEDTAEEADEEDLEEN